MIVFEMLKLAPLTFLLGNPMFQSFLETPARLKIHCSLRRHVKPSTCTTVDM